MPHLTSLLASFRHRRGMTLAAVTILGLGLGATLAVGAFVDARLIRPLPFPDPDRLAVVFETAPEQPRRGVAPANFLDWRQELTGTAALAGVFTSPRTVDTGREAERQPVSSVSANFFMVLGVPAAIGRTFQPAEDIESGARLVVLSDVTWRSRFGGEPGVVGETVRLDEVPYEIVGIMPSSFHPPEPAALWVLGERGVPTLSGFTGELSRNRDVHYFRVLARLSPDATLDAMEARLGALAERLARTHPETNRDLGIVVVPLREAATGSQHSTLLVLLGAVGFLLMTAAANTANLLLTSTAGRWQELAVRAALGATRSRLVIQLTMEGAMIGLVAGTLGSLLAWLVVHRLVEAGPLGFAAMTPAVVDARVVGIGFGLAVLVGTGAMLVPALRATTPGGLARSRGSRHIAGGREGRLRSGLTVLQLALSMTLLTGAGLLTKSYRTLSHVDPGFEAAGVVVVEASVSRATYPTAAQVLGYYERAIAALASQPGVIGAAAVSHLPTSGRAMNRGFRIEGRPDPVRGTDQTIDYQVAAPRYFEVMRIPVRAGRALAPSDGAGATPVVVVNEAAVARYWPDGSPIGARVGFGRQDGGTTWATVVGIVGDVRHAGLDAAPAPEVYVPLAQDPPRGMSLVAQTTALPATLLAARQAVRAVDPSQAVAAPRPLDDQVWTSLARPRFLAGLLNGFAGLAVVLAAIGLYGVLSQVVQARTRELGVRLAVGARPGQVVALILRSAASLVGRGVLLGLGGALLLTRVLSGMLFGVSVLDPWIYGTTALLLVAVAVIAAGGPARRAARLDPARVLSAADG